MKSYTKHAFTCFMVMLLFGITYVNAQQKPLTVHDYEKWSRIVNTNLSNNGEWFAYTTQPNGGDNVLHIKSLIGNTVYEIPNGNRAMFSKDNKWATYLITPGQDEQKKLKKQKKPILSTAELLNLSTGEKIEIERADKIQFLKGGGFWLVQREKHPDDKSTKKGSDLVLMDLKTLKSMSIGNVSEFSENKKQSFLAYLTNADDNIGNGLYILDLATSTIQAIDTDTLVYSSLTWDDKDAPKAKWNTKGNALAVIKQHKVETLTHEKSSLLIAENIGINTKLTEIKADAFPTGMVLSSDRNLTWTSNATSIIVGLKKQEVVHKMSKDTVANVEVWHWNDDRIQSVQKRQLNRDLRFTYAYAVHTNDKSIVALTNDDVKTLLTSTHPKFMVVRDDDRLRNDVNWGVTPTDLYRIDLKSGAKIRFAENIKRALGYSPDGRYYLYQKVSNGVANMIVYDLEHNKTTNLTQNTMVKFMNVDHIYPHENPTYGIAGWTADKKSVLVNHKYDIWELTLDGSKATNITKGEGEKNNIIFRYTDLNPDEEYINKKEEITLSAFGELTKKNGFYSLKIGSSPKSLLYKDANFGRPTKAENANVVVLTRQTFVDFPDYYKTNTKFNKLSKITDVNPQQKEYAWGSRKLVEFKNGKGRTVQGTLTLPANYEKGKKYPTIIYFYEKMSDRHHSYSMPRYDDRPHMSTYASNGYMVFMPDVYFEEGKPGTSSLDGITSAAQALIDQGYADPDNIGLQGHSWGGYQTSFILTQTDMFKTIVIGAPPTNLESFYNNIYGSTGTNHHGIMEIGQVRMGRGATPWTAREAYQRENPMFHVPNINTPFLILHGTADGAVDWSQGLELYNAARRLDKEVIFLSYPGEGHHLSNKANQIDFQIRMKQYFDAHLKGAEAPKWMIDGVPHINQNYRKAK